MNKPLTLAALAAFTDNYLWMLHDGQRAVVVDPGDAAPVVAALDAARLTLAGILVTHHHADHVGGVDALRPRLQGPVWGPRRERIPAPYVALDDGDTVDVLGLRFDVVAVPGHTAGHIAYVQHGDAGAVMLQHRARPAGATDPADDAQDDADELPLPGLAGDDDWPRWDAPPTPARLMFCGDTLFSAGCGRLFEGTAAQMAASLARLNALPPSTWVCCTHEYTLSNLRFAALAEPDNLLRDAHAERCRQRRADGLPTLPSTLALERHINPFLRTDRPALAAAVQARGDDASTPLAVFGALREWKNRT